MTNEFILKFMDEFVQKVVPLKKSIDEAKQPALKWGKTFDDSPYRKAEWINKGNNFGFNWKKGVIDIDTDSTEQAMYIKYYLEQKKAKYFYFKSARGMHFILATKNSFLKTASNYKSIMLHQFDIRTEMGYSAIKLEGEDLREIIPSIKGLEPSLKDLTLIEDLQAFDEIMFRGFKKAAVSDISLNHFIALNEEEGTIHEKLLAWKRMAMAMQVPPEVFEYAGEYLKHFLVDVYHIKWIKDHQDWDNQIKSYRTEKDQEFAQKLADSFDGDEKEKISVRLERDVQSLFDKELIIKNKEGGFVLVSDNNFIELVDIKELAQQLVKKEQFKYYPLPSRADHITKALNSAKPSKIIDFNDGKYRNLILFNNGYLDTREDMQEFFEGKPQTYCSFMIPTNIDLKSTSIIFNELFEAFVSKLKNDRKLATAFFKNILDVNSRDGFATFIDGPGNMGKTQFIEFLGEKILGENGCAVSLNQIIERPLTKWANKMLIFGNETSEKTSLITSDNIKAMITRDLLSTRNMYSDWVSIRNRASILFACNKKFNTAAIAADGSLERRMFFLHWDSYLFPKGATPKWYNKHYSPTKKEKEEFFSAWVRLFTENKDIFNYQDVIVNSPLNGFKKHLVGSNSVYSFLEYFIDDVCNATHNGKKKEENFVKVALNDTASGEKDCRIDIKRDYFRNLYVEYCKRDGLLAKSQKNVKEELERIIEYKGGENRVKLGDSQDRVWVYTFELTWDPDKQYKIQL